MTQHSHRGFTLWNLLLVILVTGILAAIIVPIFLSLQRARAESRKTSCLSHMKEIAMACLAYTRDHEGALPHSGATAHGPDIGWVNRIHIYTGSQNLYRCPEDATRTPLDRPDPTRFTSYYFNERLSGKSVHQISSASQIVLLGEGEAATTRYACRDFAYCIGLAHKYAVGAVPESARMRHSERPGYAFVDGHVKSLPRHQVSEIVSGPNYGFAWE